MYAKIFKERIKKAREEIGYKQKEVSEKTGIDRSKLSKLETGIQEPNLDQLGILAEFYEVSTDWLIGIGKKRDKEQ